jgi:RNA polymerase subunit RPABC4/transcription elongation factor Spt4
MVSGQLSEPCPLLPVETKVCPTCGEGIRPARGFTWVDAASFIPPVTHGTAEHDAVCPLSPDPTPRAIVKLDHVEPIRFQVVGVPGTFATADEAAHAAVTTPRSRMGDRVGLIWIGAVHYPTPQSFMREAAEMGVSRRITAVPRDFVIGETWILLGHRRAAEHACSDCGDLPKGDPECPVCDGSGYESVPGIITAFRPTAVEYVTTGLESEEEIEALEKRGITPVEVILDETQTRLV